MGPRQRARARRDGLAAALGRRRPAGAPRRRYGDPDDRGELGHLVNGEVAVEVVLPVTDGIPMPELRLLRTSTGEKLLSEERGHWTPSSLSAAFSSTCCLPVWSRSATLAFWPIRNVARR